MPKKQNLQTLAPMPEKTGDEESDNELEYVAKPVKQAKPVAPSTMPIEVPKIVEAPKEKKKRNLTEEHKQALRDRLVIAHQRKQELAAERRKEKDAIEAEYNKKKEMKIMMEAERLKRVREKDLKKIEVAKPKKKPVVVYYDEDEDSEEEEEEEEQIIIKSKKKPQKTASQIQQPIQQQPVYQQPAPSFQIKFM